MAFDGEDRKKGRLQERAKEWLARSDGLFSARSMMNTRWQTLAEIFDPDRADFTLEWTDGQDPYYGLYTSEPQILRRNMANRFGSMTRPKGVDWFKQTSKSDELMGDHEVREWCEDATTRQRKLVYAASSGFTRAFSQADSDYVTYGNAVVEYGYNQTKSGLFFSCAHLRDCAWAENAELVVDELHKRMKLPLKQAIGLFGLKNLPPEWQKLADKGENLSQKVEVVRCVLPVNEDMYEASEKPRSSAKYCSIYIARGVKDQESGIAEGYFDVFPYSVHRWVSRVGSAYARSPCADLALADGRTLNSAEAAALQGIERQADPALTAPDDGVIGEIRIGAGEITYRDRDYDAKAGGPFIEAIPGGEPRTALEYIKLKEMKMARAFFMDLLLMPDREMTLGEYTSRLEIVLRDAAPVFEPIEADYARLMDGVFELARTAHGPADPWGMFRPAPEALQGEQTQFEFITALTNEFTKLRRLQYMDVQQQYLTLSEAQSPAADYINMDKAVGESLKNFPSEWTREEDEVEQMRQQRSEQQQAAQQQTMALQVAETAAKTRPENLRMLKDEMENGQ